MKALLVICLLLVSCTDESRAARVLEEAGYTDVQITGYAWLGGCSDDDDYHTGFSAKGPTGKRTTGVVCCGVVKNCTIRTE